MAALLTCLRKQQRITLCIMVVLYNFWSIIPAAFTQQITIPLEMTVSCCGERWTCRGYVGRNKGKTEARPFPFPYSPGSLFWIRWQLISLSCTIFCLKFSTNNARAKRQVRHSDCCCLYGPAYNSPQCCVCLLWLYWDAQKAPSSSMDWSQFLVMHNSYPEAFVTKPSRCFSPSLISLLLYL